MDYIQYALILYKNDIQLIFQMSIWIGQAALILYKNDIQQWKNMQTYKSPVYALILYKNDIQLKRKRDKKT